MRIERFGSLDVRLTGGADREGGGDGPLVVLLHGFGAPGTDLVGLFRVLRAPRGTRFAFPEAPLDLGPMYAGGRAWWRIDVAALERDIASGRGSDLTRRIPDGMPEARDALVGCLDAMTRELGVPDGRLVLGGFSQGAMLALDTALRTDRALAGLALWSGTFVAADEWRPLFAKRAGLPALVSHGSSDPLLPFAVSEALATELRAGGLEVQWVPFRGQHEIPMGVLEETGALLERVLG